MRFDHLAISWKVAEKIYRKHRVTPAEAREAFEQGTVLRGPRSPDGGRSYIVRGRTYSGRKLKLLVKPRGKGVAFLITALDDR